MKSMIRLMTLAVIATVISGCLGKEEESAGPTTETLRCVERGDPNDLNSQIIACHELTHSSDNAGAAIGRCPIAENQFTGETCTVHMAAVDLSAVANPFSGTCEYTNMIEGLTTPGTSLKTYCYGETSSPSCVDNGTYCGVAAGTWTAAQ